MLYHSLVTKPSVSSVAGAGAALGAATRARGSGGGGMLAAQQWTRRFSYAHWGGYDDGKQVLYGLMAANTAVFVMWYTLDPTFMGRHFLCSPASVLVDLRAYTLLTCSFSHIGFSHFAFNMFGLYTFGQAVGQRYGGAFLLKSYVAAAVVGSLSQIALSQYKINNRSKSHIAAGQQQQPMLIDSTSFLGSSAVNSAWVMWYTLSNPFATFMIYGVIPMPAWLCGGLYLVYDSSSALGLNPNGSKTAVGGHLGGMALGAAYWLYERRRFAGRRGRW